MPNRRKTRLLRVATVLAAVAVVVCAGYIVSHQLGLNEEYDFGAGAYYYADSPQLQDITTEAQGYESSVPRWVHIVLFLAWGWLMYRLWVWVDGKNQRKHENNH